MTLFGLLGLMLAAQGLAVATLAGDADFQEATRSMAGMGMAIQDEYLLHRISHARAKASYL